MTEGQNKKLPRREAKSKAEKKSGKRNHPRDVIGPHRRKGHGNG